MTNTHLFIKPNYLRMWEFSIIAPMIVSGVLIWLLLKGPRADSFPDQVLKANSEKVL